MKAGHILSAGLVSILVFGCNQATEPSPRAVDGRAIAPAVNALTKAAAVKSGYGISREAAAGDVDPFSEDVARMLTDIGICDNFIQLVREVANSVDTTGGNLMNSPRFQKVLACFEKETPNLMNQSTEDPYAILPIFDKCFCDGSGTVFGAIRAYAFARYSAPQLNGYSAPATRGYGSPSAAPGYSAPSAAPGYSAPSL